MSVQKKVKVEVEITLITKKKGKKNKKGQTEKIHLEVRPAYKGSSLLNKR